MHWDDFFQDLEDQLSAEWEAERAALDSETERLRIARMGLRERVVAIARQDERIRLELCDETCCEATIDAVGADWAAARQADGAILLVRLAAIVSVALAERVLVSSARAGKVRADRIAERVTFGFALRDLARRRVAVTVGTSLGRVVSGTFDRVAADHGDLALHDAGAPRRESEVQGFRLIPFDGIAWVRAAALSATVLGA